MAIFDSHLWIQLDSRVPTPLTDVITSNLEIHIVLLIHNINTIVTTLLPLLTNPSHTTQHLTIKSFYFFWLGSRPSSRWPQQCLMSPQLDSTVMFLFCFVFHLSFCCFRLVSLDFFFFPFSLVIFILFTFFNHSSFHGLQVHRQQGCCLVRGGHME